MILHVANLDKFIPPFVEFINERFDSSEHHFYIRSNNKKYEVKRDKNVVLSNGGALSTIIYFSRLFFHSFKAKKIILHGLFDSKLLVLLLFMPWVYSKCYWVLWGGDYMERRNSNKNYKLWIKESLKKYHISRFGNLITYIPGSVKIVRECYGAKGKFHECLAYTSNVYDGTFKEAIESSGELNVLIGNSATKTNQHLDAFKKISLYFNENIKIYCPLSYGDPSYAQEVIAHGKSLFGNNFIPLTDFLPIKDYNSLMQKIDMVIFNHNRHQAMGNIINFLGMGKPIYLNRGLASWDFLISKGITVFDIEKIDGLSSSKPLIENHKIVKNYFSYKNLEKQWRGIFNDE